MPENQKIKREAMRMVRMNRGKLIQISLIIILSGGTGLLGFISTQVAIFAISAVLHTGAVVGTTAGVLKWIYLLLALHLLSSIWVGSFIEIGFARLLLHRTRGEAVPMEILLFFRKRWLEAVMLRLLMAIKTLLWSMLFIFPGCFAMLRYAMAPYLMAQHPQMGAPEAIKVSTHLMQGYKKKLFFLILSFADEIIISILTLGIPFVYVVPRIEAAVAVFYWERVALHDKQLRELERSVKREEKKYNEGN